MIIRLFTFFFCLFLSSLSACDHLMQFYETKYEIPTNLLKAISHVESGRVNEYGRMQSDLFVINAQGKGYRFTSKQEAIQKIRELQAQGIQSIDVGCMQINLKHHPKAFKNLDEAFDPHKNVDYGARYLTSLKQNFGNWTEAVGRYHSSSSFHKNKYYNLVKTRLSSLGTMSTVPVMSVYKAPTRPHSYEKEAQKAKNQVVSTSMTSQNGVKMPVNIQFAPLKMPNNKQAQQVRPSSQGPMNLAKSRKIFQLSRKNDSSNVENIKLVRKKMIPLSALPRSDYHKPIPLN